MLTICPMCDGNGWDEEGEGPCPECGGSGEIEGDDENDTGFVSFKDTLD